MEELQSTELLDREILEDARKKAHRVLKTADDAIKAKSTEWERKLSADLDELGKKYAKQLKLAEDEIMARLPIDQRRTKAKKIEELLNAAVAHWYASLSRERVLELLQKELAKRLALGDTISGSQIRVFVHGIEQAEAKSLLQTVLPGAACTIEEVHSADAYPEITVETPQARVYASIKKLVDFFLAEKRAELDEALLGPLGE